MKISINFNLRQKQYDILSPFYNFIFGRILENGRKVGVDLANICSGGKILEIGVGTGLTLEKYNPVNKIYAIDISLKMLKEAKRLPHINLIKMNSENLAFADNSFDCITAFYVASVVNNPVKMMKELSRVCKSGGTIIIVNHFASKNRLINYIERIFTPLTEKLGWKANFPEKLIIINEINLVNRKKVNLFGYWYLLQFINKK